jgi:hypothetical protein
VTDAQPPSDRDRQANDRDRQVDTGGADAVPDTPHVAAHGSEPGGDSAGYKARVGPGGGGIGAAGWLVLFLALVVALIYGFGFFR